MTPSSPSAPPTPKKVWDRTGLVNSCLDRLKGKMRLCAPYSCASAPLGDMLIGWPGHKTRKRRLPVARTGCLVFCDERKANELSGAGGNIAQPRMAASVYTLKGLSFLGSFILKISTAISKYMLLCDLS